MKSSGKTIHKAYWQLLTGISLLVLAVALVGHRPAETPAIIGATGEEPLRIVVTIAPLYALTAGVSEGVTQPYQLLKAGDTPHHFQLKPQDAERVAAADVVISLSLTAEYYLAPLLHSLPEENILHVEAAKAEGIILLPAAPDGDGHEEADYDIHLWLDPQNAIAITRQIATALEMRDPAHADRYRKNAAKQIAALETLDAETSAVFASRAEKTAAYVIFHPVLRYYERRYGITPAEKAVAAVPEAGASAAEAVALEQALNADEYRCILQETEFSSKLLANLAANHPALKSFSIDPLGNQFPPSPAQYAQLIRHVTEVVNQCLK